MFFEKIAPYTYRIPRQGKMRVDAVFFASKEILKDPMRKTTPPCSSS